MEGVKPIIKPKAAQFEKKYCAKTVAMGLKGCLKVATDNAAFIRDIALYKLAGRHSIALSFKPSKCWDYNICAFCRSGVHKTIIDGII